MKRAQPDDVERAHRVCELVDQLPMGIVETDHVGSVVACNAAACDAMGADLLSLEGPLSTLVHPADRDAVVEAIMAASARNEPYEVTFRLDRPTQTDRWVQTTGRVRVDENGAFRGLIGVLHDATDAFNTRRKERRFTDMLDAATDFVVFLDPDGRITWGNRAARCLVSDLTDQPAGMLRPWLTEASWERWECDAFPAVLSGGVWQGELDLALGANAVLPVTASVVGHCDANGELEFISWIARDVTELKEAHRILEAQATHDALTGLPNRSLFLEHLGTAIKRVGRNAPALAVMFCDLDGFKAVNDGLGHEAGDQLLVEVAQRFRDSVRDGDVVARFGGDEFCILLPGVDSVETAQLIADRIMRRIEEPIDLDSGEGNVGTSIGIAVCTDATADPEHLLAEADAAMYTAKAQGKRRQQLFDDDLRSAARVRSELVKAMPAAIDQGEFEPLYMPVVSLADGRLVGIEAGLRWHHTTRGTLDPGDWVPLAYEAGTILSLDRLAIGDGCTRASEWNAGRDEDDVVTVWITVGAQDLLRGGLADHITRRIEMSGAGPGSFGVEVGLEAIAKHPREAQEILQSLSWLGVRVALDDFGAGNFTLSQLQRYRAETIKLDRRLVRSLASEPDAITSVSAIVHLARALGLIVQAKGVNNIAELELLQDLGVHHAQGDVIGRATGATDVFPLFERETAWPHGPWPRRRVLEGGHLSRAQVLERMLVLRQAAAAEARRAAQPAA